LEEKPLNLKTLLSFFEKEFLVKNGFRKKKKKKKRSVFRFSGFSSNKLCRFSNKRIGIFLEAFIPGVQVSKYIGKHLLNFWKKNSQKISITKKLKKKKLNRNLGLLN